jgi:hypothetical protein
VSRANASYHAVRCTLLSGDPRPLHYDAWAWATPGELSAYALPVAQRRIAALAAEPSLFTGSEG